MAGFAAAIGGMGSAAADYGHQVRGLLEQRRGDFVTLLTALANQEVDPQRRSEYLDHASDLLKGKDLSKIVPGAVKTLQDHHQSNEAMAQAVGGQPEQPKPVPGPAAPGSTPGTLQAPVMPQIAAQPSTSPVQPAQQKPGGIQGIMAMPEFQTPAGRQFLAPLVSNEAELSRQRSMKDLDLEYRRKGLAAVKALPFYNTLPDFAKASYEAQAEGLPGVNLPQGALVPNRYSSRAEELEPAVLERFGLKDFKGPVTVSKDRLSGAITDIVPANPGVSIITNDDGTQSFVLKNPGAAGVAPSQVSAHAVTMPDMTTGFNTMARVTQGMHPVSNGGVSSAAFPHVTSSERSISTVDAAGNPVTQLVPVQSISSRLPVQGKPQGGAPAIGPVRANGGAPQGGRTFEKPLTAEQTLKGNQQYEQYHTAIDRANRVLKNIHLLDSLVDSGKLELQLHDGILTNILSRGVHLTPAEAQLATDFNSLRESVNLIRGPLGATGFRGPEAFAALQSQRGKLLGNPQITKGALQTFITELQNQVKPLAEKLHKGGGEAAGPKVTHRFNPTTGKIEEVQ